MNDEPPEEHGVSIEVFTGFIRVLQKAHGRKMAGPGFNDFVPLAAKIEAMYKRLDPEVKKLRRKKTGGVA